MRKIYDEEYLGIRTSEREAPMSKGYSNSVLVLLKENRRRAPTQRLVCEQPHRSHQLKCPSTTERLNMVWGIHIGEQ